MPWTSDQLRAYELRQAPKHRSAVPEDAVLKEVPLHDDIMAWCSAQWPRWKYIHCRTDRETTIAEGAADFTVFGPFPLCLLVECKTKTGKLSPKQLAWAAEMELLGWTVSVVRSKQEFLNAVEAAKSQSKPKTQ